MARLAMGIGLTLVGALALIGSASSFGVGARMKTLAYVVVGVALVAVGVATITAIGPEGLDGGGMF